MDTPKPFSEGCLVCGDSTKGGGRGLCQKHYRQFKRAFDSFENPEDANAFEAKSLEEGWIEPKQVGGRPKTWTPFDALAEKVRTASSMYDPKKAAADDADIERAKEEARKMAAKQKMKYPKSSTDKKKKSG
jgi:hypothetical protein